MMKRFCSMILAAALMLSAVCCAGAAEAAEEPVPAAASIEETVPVSAEEALAPVAEPTEAPTEPAEAMPVITTAEPAKDGVKLSFTAYEGAARYRIFIKKADGSGWRGVGDTAALNFTRTGMADYSTDIYTVRALDANGRFCSSYDKEGYSYTYLPAPKLKKAESITGGVKVMWDAVNGAPGYRVYAKTTGSWKCLGETADTSYTDGNVTSGSAYTYTVKARDNENGVLLSYHDTTGIKVTYVAVPVLSSVSAVDGGNKITWKKSNGAAKYRVFTKNSNGTGWKGVGDTSSTSFIHKITTNHTVNTYTVRALNAKGAFISDYDKEGLTATYYSTPVLGKVTNENGGQRISWKATPGAVSYRVYAKNGSDWKGIGNTSENYYVNAGVQPGASYTYTVRVCSADGKTLQSYFNKNGVSSVYVAAPEITGFTPAEGGMKIRWSKSDGASKYRVFYKKDDGSGWKGIGDTTGTSLTHTNPTDQTVYTYTVRALDAKGAFISGYDKSGRDCRYIAPPKIARIIPVNGDMHILWGEVPTVSGYILYRKTFGGTWSSLTQTVGLSYTDYTVNPDTLYAYTLRCVDANGKLCSYYDTDTLYYYNGALANGKITVGGSSLMFSQGRVRQGYVTIDGKTYYYDSKGNLMKDGIVGSDKEGWRYADKNGVINTSFSGIAQGNGGWWYVKNGVIDKTIRETISYGGSQWNVIDGKARKVVTEEDKVLYRAFKLLAKVTKKSMTKEQKLRAMWDYIRDAYVEENPRIPHYKGMDWPIIYANDMLINGVGNCMSYAAEFCYLAKAIGYDDIYACHSGIHGWAEIDGLIYDPEWSRHVFKYNYYGLSYDAKTDQDYKGKISAGLPWMHVKICADY